MESQIRLSCDVVIVPRKKSPPEVNGGLILSKLR